MKRRNGIIKRIMKLPKKVYLAAAVLLFMGGAGTAVAFYPDSEPKKVVVEQVASQEPQNAPESEIAEAPVVEEQAVEQEPVEGQPRYGEHSPGVYKVFDTAWVLNEAGIPAEQHEAASELISKLSDWVYHSTAIPEGVSPRYFNLCRADPIIKMSIIASDYETNPVTQLKWCHRYVSERIGTWQQALDRYLADRRF